MRSSFARVARFLSPESVDRLRGYRNSIREWRFAHQGFTKIKCGSYELEAPRSHPLASLHRTQPYRDLCVGIGAREVSRKYPDSELVDIGANIGDTAAMMATYAPNKLVLVEGSDYFFSILSRNARLLPNEVKLIHTLVADGDHISGDFAHASGTASFTESMSTRSVATSQLCQVCPANTGFLKIDTDGYDFRILRAGLDWLSVARPVVIFENQIRDELDRESCDSLFLSLLEIGYEGFIVWDDPGFHLVSTSSIAVLRDLNRYLLKRWQTPGLKSICNYDIMCLHKQDVDLYDSITGWCRSY